MARIAWIGILGFGLFLFILLDVFIAWFVLYGDPRHHVSWSAVWALIGVALLTEDVYLALRSRIDGKQRKSLIGIAVAAVLRSFA